MKGILFFILGLILTMGGVGGVENSITNTQLLQSTAAAFLGLCLMYVSVMVAQTRDWS